MKFSLNIKREHVLMILLAVLVSFVIGHQARAGVGDWVIDVMSNVFSVVVGFMGILITLIISAIIWVAQYNDFINSPAVTSGWVVVRDVCNMFFILVVLIIAFSTILRYDKFSMKKFLPQVVIMAILVNFSKTICGICIDAAGVVMLTFVNGFKDFGGPQLTQILGIEKMVSLAKSGPGSAAGVDAWDVLITYFFAFAYMLIAIVVLLAMLGTLVTRVIMLWIYIVLSPLAYVSNVLPQTSSANGKWWGTFTKLVVTGPLLAFFIWLSLSTLMKVAGNDPKNISSAMLGGVPQSINVGSSDITTSEFFIGYIISIGLLIGGLVVAKDYGGAAGGAAAWGYKKINSGAGWAKKKATGYAKSSAKAVGRGVGSVTLGSAKFVDGALTGGAVGRGVGFVKDNMTSRAGVSRIKDALVMQLADRLGSNSLVKLNSKAAQMRQSIGANKKFVDEDGVTWEASENEKGEKEKGLITVKGQSLYNKDEFGNITGKKSAEEREKLLPKIDGKTVEIYAMDERFAKGIAGYQSNVLSVRSAAAKAKKDKEEVEKFKKEYEHLATESEIDNRLKNTTNVNRRKALGLIAAEKGFTPTAFNKNAQGFKEERDKADEKTEYEKAVEKKLKEISKLDFAGLKKEYGAVGDIKKSDFKKDKDGNYSEADLNKLAGKFAIQQQLERRGEWGKFVDALTAMGGKSEATVKGDARAEADDMKSINKDEIERTANKRQSTLDDINRREGAAQREEFAKVKDLYKYTPGLMKQFMESSMKTRPELVWDMENKAHADAFSAALKKKKVTIKDMKVDYMDAGSLGKVLQIAKDAIGPERYGSEIADIDKNGSKAFASKIGESSVINAARQDAKAAAAAPDSSERIKAEREAQAYRINAVALSGDLRKAFSKFGELDVDGLKKFAQTASAKQLEQIDASTMDDQIARLLASQINSAKATQLIRNDNNPELVNKILDTWSKTNDPNGIKALNISPSLVMNVPAANRNGAIQNLLRELKGAGSADATIAKHLANLDITDIGTIDKYRASSTSDSGYKKVKGKIVLENSLKDAIKIAVNNGTWAS